MYLHFVVSCVAYDFYDDVNSNTAENDGIALTTQRNLKYYGHKKSWLSRQFVIILPKQRYDNKGIRKLFMDIKATRKSIKFVNGKKYSCVDTLRLLLLYNLVITLEYLSDMIFI